MSEFDVKKTKRYQNAVQGRDWQTCDLMFEEFNFLKKQLAEKDAENKKLREALKFYADINNWSYQQIIDDISEINGSLEGGKLARKTLKELDE